MKRGRNENESVNRAGAVEKPANHAREVADETNRIGGVAGDENLRQLRDVWPRLGVGQVSIDLYDRFQRFKAELEDTLWKQFGHSPMGLSDHDFFIEIVRAVEREREEQK